MRLEPLPQERPIVPPFFSPSRRGSVYYAGFWAIIGVYAPFMNVYFSRLGLTASQIGLLSTLFPLMMLVTAPVLSALADRYARRRTMLQASLVTSALMLFLLGVPQEFAALALVSLVFAFFRSPATAIADGLIARMASRYRLNYGNMRLWGSLSFAIAAVASGLAWRQLGFRPMFALAAALTAPLLLFTTLLEEGPPVDRQRRQPFRKVAGNPGLVVIVASAFLLGAGMNTCFNFGSIYLDSLGGDPFALGLFSAIMAFCEVPAMRNSDYLLRRLGGPRALILASGMSAVAAAGFAVAQGPTALLVANAGRGFGFGLFYVCAVRLVNDRVPEEWSSTAQAMLGAAMMGLAPLLSSPVGGWVYDTLGPVALFAGATFVVVLAMAMVIVAAARGLFTDSPPA